MQGFDSKAFLLANEKSLPQQKHYLRRLPITNKKLTTPGSISVSAGRSFTGVLPVVGMFYPKNNKVAVEHPRNEAPNKYDIVATDITAGLKHK